MLQSRKPILRSKVFPFIDPVAILAVPSYTPGALPAILAEVGVGMTGQPYELFTFAGGTIVPVQMTFPIGWLPGLTGGGAAQHGQGVYCAAKADTLQVTQVEWSGPGPSAPTTSVSGGESAAPNDQVTVDFQRWVLAGQPLRQVRIHPLPSRSATYVAATAMENVHC